MPVARNQIPNMHQWTNWEEVLSTHSMQQLYDAAIEELLETVFSMQSMLRCYKQDRSRVLLVGKESPASKGMNVQVEGSMALEAITRQRLGKTQQTEKA
jgi:hypothetical protein